MTPKPPSLSKRQSRGGALPSDIQVMPAKASHVIPTPTSKERLPRRCIATRQRQHRNGMIRFVLGPGNVVVPDLEEKLPGRGLWVRQLFVEGHQSMRFEVFEEGERQEIRRFETMPPDLVATVTELVRKRCLRWIGLARGASQLRLGDFQVQDALAKGEVAVLVEAHDGKDNGRSKVLSKARGLPVVMSFGRAELGQAVGRNEAVHLAFCTGRLSTHFLDDVRRYAGITGLKHPQMGGEQ